MACLRLTAQNALTIPDSMRVKPNWELLKQKIKYQQESSSSRYSKDVKGITAEDLENMVVINVLKIFPDTTSPDKIIYKTDKDIFFIYLPSKSKLYMWKEPEGFFVFAQSYQIYTRTLELIMDSMDNVNTSDPFFISFFPMDGGRHQLVAYKVDGQYKCKDAHYNLYFASFDKAFEYFFSSTVCYADIFKKRAKFHRELYEWRGY